MAEGKTVVSVPKNHTMQAYRRSEGTYLCILNLSTRWRWVTVWPLYSWRKPLVPIQ